MSDSTVPTPHLPEVTDATFQAEVVEASRSMPIFIDFWAEWCTPCRMVSPVIKRLSQDEKYKDKVKFVAVDTDSNPQLVQMHGIMSIPTLMIYKDGEMKISQAGAMPEEALRQFIDSNI